MNNKQRKIKLKKAHHHQAFSKMKNAKIGYHASNLDVNDSGYTEVVVGCFNAPNRIGVNYPFYFQ